MKTESECYKTFLFNIVLSLIFLQQSCA